MKRFIFIVHPLTAIQRTIMAFRCRLWRGLYTNVYTQKDIAVVSRFHWRNQVEGIVISIPMLPMELVEEQEKALAYMHYAYRLGLAQFGAIDAIGLGALCSVVASRCFVIASY